MLLMNCTRVNHVTPYFNNFDDDNLMLVITKKNIRIKFK